MDQTQSSGSGVPSDLVYWQSLGGEGYEGPYSTCSIRASIPGMLQQPLGNYSGAGEMQMTARYARNNMARTANSRQKSGGAKKIRRSQRPSENQAAVIHAQDDTVSMIPYNSNGFMRPVIAPPITTLPNPYHALSSPTQQLSYPAGISTTEAISYQSAPFPISTNYAGSSHHTYSPATYTMSNMYCTPVDEHENLDWSLLDNHCVADPSSASMPITEPNCSNSFSTITNGQATAQQIPVSQGVLFPHSDVSNCISYGQQQIIPQFQDQPAPAQVAEKVVKQPSPCNNSSSAIDNTQQPLQTAQNVSQSHKEQPSLSITTSAHSSKTSVFSDRASVAAIDQQLSCASPSHPVNAECHSDSSMPAQAPLSSFRKRKQSLALENGDDHSVLKKACKKDMREELGDLVRNEFRIIGERIEERDKGILSTFHKLHEEFMVGSERREEELREANRALSKQFEEFKEKSEQREEELKEANRALSRQLEEFKKKSEQREEEMIKEYTALSKELQTLYVMKVKMEGSVKKEAQGNCLPGTTIKEESNGIRAEDCSWKGESLLGIESKDPCKFALKLLQKLFEAKERVGKCYRVGPHTSNKKQPLDEERIKILEDCIKYRYGLQVFLAHKQQIVKKCNQKCLDANKKVKIKEEAHDQDLETDK